MLMVISKTHKENCVEFLQLAVELPWSLTVVLLGMCGEEMTSACRGGAYLAVVRVALLATAKVGDLWVEGIHWWGSE